MSTTQQVPLVAGTKRSHNGVANPSSSKTGSPSTKKPRKTRKTLGKTSDTTKPGNAAFSWIPSPVPTMPKSSEPQIKHIWQTPATSSMRPVGNGFPDPSSLQYALDPCCDSSHPHYSDANCCLENATLGCEDNSFPCNNPECDDVQPCGNHFDYCNDSGCMGNICFDQNCTLESGELAPCYDQNCEVQTHCANPCFGQDCSAPDCSSSCLQPEYGKQTNPFTANSQGQTNICFQEDCVEPHRLCLDPSCLNQIHQPTNVNANEHWHHYGGREKSSQDRRHLGPGDFPLTQNGLFPDVSAQNSGWSPNHWDVSNAKRSFAAEQPPPYFQQQHQWNFGSGMSPTDTASVPPELSTSMTTTPSTSVSWMAPSTASPSNQYQCLWRTSSRAADVCSHVFPNAHELHQHVEQCHIDALPREDTANNGFFCHWAGCSRNMRSSFAARPKLKRHAQTHTMYKPYNCPMCGVQMKTKDAMEKHARTHSGERPYACREPGCEKVFATSTELKTHGVVHSGRKPHECPICGEGFADSSNLSKHKKTHFIGMYKCPVSGCTARMKRWDQMRRHMSSQKHGQDILHNPGLQRDYKARMEREWRELPDEAKAIKLEHDNK